MMHSEPISRGPPTNREKGQHEITAGVTVVLGAVALRLVADDPERIARELLDYVSGGDPRVWPEQGRQRLRARPRLGLRALVGYDREGKCLMCVTINLDPRYTRQMQPVAVIENDNQPVFD